MKWLLNMGVKLAFKYLITPRNFRWAMGKAAKQLKILAASTEYLDIDDKAVKVFIQTFKLEEESK